MMTKTHMGFVIHAITGDEFYCIHDAEAARDKAIIEHLDEVHAHEVHDEASMEFCCVCGHVLQNIADR